MNAQPIFNVIEKNKNYTKDEITKNITTIINKLIINDYLLTQENIKN